MLTVYEISTILIKGCKYQRVNLEQIMEIFVNTFFLIANKTERKEKRHNASGSGLCVNYTILAVADTRGQESTGTSVVDTSLPLPTTPCSMTKKKARKTKTTKGSTSPAQSKEAVFWSIVCLFSSTTLFLE